MTLDHIEEHIREIKEGQREHNKADDVRFKEQGDAMSEIKTMVATLTQKVDDGFKRITEKQDYANGRTAKVEAQAEANNLDIALIHQTLQGIVLERQENKTGFKNMLFGVGGQLLYGAIIAGFTLYGMYAIEKINRQTEDRYNNITAQLEELELIQ